MITSIIFLTKKIKIDTSNKIICFDYFYHLWSIFPRQTLSILFCVTVPKNMLYLWYYKYFRSMGTKDDRFFQDGMVISIWNKSRSDNWLISLWGKWPPFLTDGIFNCIFLNENYRISIPISLKSVPRNPIDNKSALIQVMACRDELKALIYDKAFRYPLWNFQQPAFFLVLTAIPALYLNPETPNQ